jgi:hypothetical protein
MPHPRTIDEKLDQLSGYNHLANQLVTGVIKLLNACDVDTEALAGRRNDIEDGTYTWMASRHLSLVRLLVSESGSGDRLGCYDLTVESAVDESFEDRLRTLIAQADRIPADPAPSGGLAQARTRDGLTFEPLMNPVDTGDYEYRLLAGLRPENPSGEALPAVEIGDIQ